MFTLLVLFYTLAGVWFAFSCAVGGAMLLREAILDAQEFGGLFAVLRSVI